MSEGSPRGQRAIRKRLIKVAGDLFTEQGYRATTTKQVCQLAQTTERTMFRHFGSKAGLFEATVVEPFSEFIDQWTSSFSTYPAERPLEEVIREWVQALVDLLDDNEVLLKQLIAADFDRDPDLGPVSARIRKEFASGLRHLADDAGRSFIASRGYNVADPPLALSAGVSIALGTVLFDDWVFTGRKPSKARVADEISQMVMYGISARPETK